MKKEVITTQAQRIWIGEDGIGRNIILPKGDITLVEAQKAVKAIAKVTKNKPIPLLVDSREIKSMSQEARRYLTSRESADVLRAIAVLVDSPISKLIGNFFINFGKPHSPTKLFTSEDEALAWLKTFLTSVRDET